MEAEEYEGGRTAGKLNQSHYLRLPLPPTGYKNGLTIHDCSILIVPSIGRLHGRGQGSL